MPVSRTDKRRRSASVAYADVHRHRSVRRELQRIVDEIAHDHLELGAIREQRDGGARPATAGSTPSAAARASNSLRSSVKISASEHAAGSTAARPASSRLTSRVMLISSSKPRPLTRMRSSASACSVAERSHDAVVQQLGVAENGAQRRAQLVRHGAEELRLQAVGAAQVFDEPRVVHRDGGLRRDPFGDAPLARRERPAALAEADAERADHPSAAHHRHRQSNEEMSQRRNSSRRPRGSGISTVCCASSLLPRARRCRSARSSSCSSAAASADQPSVVVTRNAPRAPRPTSATAVQSHCSTSRALRAICGSTAALLQGLAHVTGHAQQGRGHVALLFLAFTRQCRLDGHRRLRPEDHGALVQHAGEATRIVAVGEDQDADRRAAAAQRHRQQGLHAEGRVPARPHRASAGSRSPPAHRRRQR